MSHLKICFLQVTSPEIHEYSQYSCLINKEYCKKHGYSYLNLNAINTKTHAPAWSKIFHTKDVLEKGNYTHVFFLDADAVVINQDKKIEEVIDKMKTFIAFSENGWNGGDLINSGCFIASKDAISILEKCIEKSNTDMQHQRFGFPWEQTVITKMYESGISMDVFSMNEINSYWLYDVNSNDGQFIYHFMARPLKEKVVIAKALYEKYIKNI